MQLTKAEYKVAGVYQSSCEKLPSLTLDLVKKCTRKDRASWMSKKDREREGERDI